MTAATAATPALPKTPSVRRRFASLVYEALILFGVGLLPGAVGALLLAVTGAPQDTAARVAGFLIYSAYFTWFWTRRGQTLPMQTWHIKLVSADGGPVTLRQALLRCVAGCLWVAPAALLAWAEGWTRWQGLTAVGVGVIAYGLLAYLLPGRQFLHDLISGTRLVDVKPAVMPPSTR